jgi:predicted AAA+ superfamily ATPase
LQKNPNVNYGAIYENVVAQELKAQGFELYYYKNSKRGEIDFVISLVNGQVIPIEVKSGKSYKRHSAMQNVLETPAFKISTGIVFSDNNIERNEKFIYLPIYMVSYLRDLFEQ